MIIYIIVIYLFIVFLITNGTKAIFHTLQKEGMAGHRLPGSRSATCFYHASETLMGQSVATHLNECANDSTHHVAEKPIGRDFKEPRIRSNLVPFGRINMAQGGLNI